MTVNQEKLAKLQALSRTGSKGVPRRKVKKTHKTVNEDKKLQSVLKKLQIQNIGAIDEVNFFMESGSVSHFSFPKIEAIPGANTFIVKGEPETKDIAELLPGILSQLGPDSIMEIKRMAEEFSRDNPGITTNSVTSKNI